MGGVNKREHLLHTGQQLIWDKGYDRCSINDITKAADLPKGSFYHYFESKEKFALEAMNNYIESFPEVLPEKEFKLRTLEDLIDQRIKAVIKINYSKECYMSVMAQSISDQDNQYRVDIAKAIDRSNEAMHTLLIELKQKKLINQKLDIDELMEFIDFSWRGARLKARVLKSRRPLRLFKKFLIKYILE